MIGNFEAAYWGEIGRSELLGLFIARLIERHWGTAVDSGWSDWDVEIHYHPWTLLQVCTAQEDLGEGKNIVRVRYRLKPTELAGVVGIMGAGAMAVLSGMGLWLGSAAAALLLVAGFAAWRRGRGFAHRAAQIFDGLAHEISLIRLGSDNEKGRSTTDEGHGGGR
jgi:hypothetical protein